MLEALLEGLGSGRENCNPRWVVDKERRLVEVEIA
jgi:hypothetical protein